MHPTSEMMSKCRKWHLREPKFAKFHEGACPHTPLEARAFGAKKYLPKHNRTPLNRIHPTGLRTETRGQYRALSTSCWRRRSAMLAKSLLKHGATLYNEVEVFSLSITNPNGRPMLPFDWLIHSSLILASCHRILFLCRFPAVEK